jgi:predicted transcriptional regulator of viral defense system
VTAYNRIFDEAIENYGLVTTSMARKLGIAPGTLVDLAYRGRLTRIGQGVYQLVQYAPDVNDPYAQGVALVGDGAYLYGESVIAMLNLAPTDPDRIYVATASRVRKNLGEGIKIFKAVVGYKPIRVEGIPSQKVVDAILSARATMPNDRLKLAVAEALRIGKIDENETRMLNYEIQ